MFSVSDTGAGIDAETQSHLFDPFFSAKPGGSRASLGLAAIHSIVKQSGGHIRVQSELEHGTTFQVFLPRAEQDAGISEPVADPSGTETILLLEDEPPVRRLAARILRDRGYQVLEAGSGPEAMRLAKQHNSKIDLLLTDVVMPRMSGREASDRLISQLPDLKILFMSGDGRDAIIDHGVLDDGFNFLQKPFTPQALAQKVRAVLDT